MIRVRDICEAIPSTARVTIVDRQLNPIYIGKLLKFFPSEFNLSLDRVVDQMRYSYDFKHGMQWLVVLEDEG